MKKLPLLCCILHVLVVSAPAVLVREFDTRLHERFYDGADGAFIGEMFDFSGVGSTGSTWATLISNQYFISAAHFHPDTNETVVFYEENSLTGPSHSYTVAGGVQIGGTDLWIGWFSSTVDASIARYPILDLPSGTDYLGLVAYNYGTGDRVGLNVLEAVRTISPGFPNSVVFIYDYDDSDTPSVGGDETFLQSGDSGAPTFSIVSGQLALTGVHAGIAFPIFGDSAVPAYISEINAVLDDKGQELMIVPEPAIILQGVFGFTLVGGTALRRKQKKSSAFQR